MDCHHDIPFVVAAQEIVAAQAPPAASALSDSTHPAHEMPSGPFSQLLGEVYAVAIGLKQLTGFPQAAEAVLDLVNLKGPMTVPQIARARSTSRQNIQVLVDRLKNERRIEIRQNPAHKKSSLVVLTAKGKQWLEENAKGRERLLSGMGAGFSAEEIQGAIAVLARVRSLLLSWNPEANRARKKFANRPRTEPTNPSDKLFTPPEDFPVNLL